MASIKYLIPFVLLICLTITSTQKLDFTNSTGPCPVATFTEAFTLPKSIKCGSNCKLTLTITAPNVTRCVAGRNVVRSQPYPLIFMFSGFQVRHASHGLVLITYMVHAIQPWQAPCSWCACSWCTCRCAVNGACWHEKYFHACPMHYRYTVGLCTLSSCIMHHASKPPRAHARPIPAFPPMPACSMVHAMHVQL